MDADYEVSAAAAPLRLPSKPQSKRLRSNPCMSDLFGLTLSGDGYLLDGEVRQFETHTENIR